MLDNFGNKLWSIVADVIQKQNYATKQLYMGFDKTSTNLTQNTYKNRTLNDTNQHLPIHQIKQPIDKTQPSSQINNQQIDKSIDSNNRKIQQIKAIKKEHHTVDGTPIQGFKFTQMNSQNEQNDLPKPKIIIQGTQKQLENNKIKINHKSIKYQLLNQKIQQSIISKIATNPSNPQQIPQIKIIKPEQSKSMCLGTNNQAPYKISNLRLKKIIGSDNNKMKKSIKTEVNLSNNNDQDLDISMDLSVQDDRIQKFNKKYSKNIQINSNVVNYCQSLNQSKIIGQSAQKEKKKIKDRKLKQLTQQKKDETNTIKKSKISKKIKTQFNQQDRFKIEQITRSQLKVVYQKKYKLQQKLKKLNRQLQKLSSQKNQKVQMGLYNQLNYSTQTIKNINPEISQYSTPIHRKYITNKFNSFDLIQKRSYRNHLKQIEYGKKAIQFVQKISKQSLKRKLQKQNKINKDIIQRVKDHVSINCSRIRCQNQAFQGQKRKYKNQINSRIIKNSNFQHK